MPQSFMSYVNSILVLCKSLCNWYLLQVICVICKLYASHIYLIWSPMPVLCNLCFILVMSWLINEFCKSFMSYAMNLHAICKSCASHLCYLQVLCLPFASSMQVMFSSSYFMFNWYFFMSFSSYFTAPLSCEWLKKNLTDTGL